MYICNTINKIYCIKHVLCFALYLYLLFVKIIVYLIANVQSPQSVYPFPENVQPNDILLPNLCQIAPTNYAAPTTFFFFREILEIMIVAGDFPAGCVGIGMRTKIDIRSKIRQALIARGNEAINVSLQFFEKRRTMSKLYYVAETLYRAFLN